jgi:alkyl hydroperoxide reductase subunit AhpC
VIPQLRDWHGKYEKDGLTIVGVHAPEFNWERPFDKVVQATKDLKVAYPVVQDNDFMIWKRFGNHYWPALVVMDRKGVVRYTHIGEGDYDVTEALIRKLLSEK